MSLAKETVIKNKREREGKGEGRREGKLRERVSELTISHNW